jgi:hypothetical protein
LARHEQFDRFGSAIAGQLFLKVTGEICKPLKRMEKVLSRESEKGFILLVFGQSASLICSDQT